MQNKEDLKKQYGSISAAAKALKLPRQTLVSRLETKGFTTETPKEGKTLSDFRAVHDKAFIVPLRIKEGLKKLGAGGWEYESSFAKLCAISLTDLSVFRELFAEYIVIVRRDGKRAWAGSPALAQRMREMVR